MSAALANPAEMVRLGAPRIIRSEEELAAYTDALFALTAKEQTTPDEVEAIDLLTLLIESYERERYTLPRHSPAAMLQHFMDQHSLTPRDLESELDGEDSALRILAGRQEMTALQSIRLSARFHVSPSVFF